MKNNIVKQFVIISAFLLILYPSYAMAYSLVNAFVDTQVFPAQGTNLYSDDLLRNLSYDTDPQSVGPLTSTINLIAPDMNSHNYAYLTTSNGYASLGTIGGSVTTLTECVKDIWDPSESDTTGAAVAFFGASWQDVILIASDTLPVGTPVNIKLSYSVIGTASWSMAPYGYPEGATGDVRYSSTFGWTSGATGVEMFDNQIGGNNATFSHYFFDIVTDYIGDQGVLHGALDLSAAATAGTYLCYYNNVYTAYGTMLASNTAHYYMDVLTPGAYLISESGTDYSTPGLNSVPEPSTIMLLGAGLAGLAFWRRRSRG